ncbi:MAG: SpoVG family protein [Candidatus Kaelpia imicola]|nr:SpoVG family protein [Candidatus Kaelpia imicola]
MLEVARLHKLNGDSALKAFADVVISGQMLVKGVRVVEGKDGLFVSMPQNQGKDGKWHEIVSLLDDELKQALQEAVLEAFNA